MLSHESVWSAIDRLARRNGLTPSGLARRAGLDPTTFNPSKRIATDGRPRWPSMESIAKILDATEADVTEFVLLLTDDSAEHLPMPAFPGLATAGFFNDDGPAEAHAWPRPDEVVPAERVIALPDHDVALRVCGGALMPFYRDGDVVVVSPGAALRKGDRVIVRHTSGRLSAHVLAGRSRTRFEFAGADGSDTPTRHGVTDIVWVARVTWASQ